MTEGAAGDDPPGRAAPEGVGPDGMALDDVAPEGVGPDGMALDDVAPEGVAPDGRPMVQPKDRAAWRAWLIANHATARGVWLVTYRVSSGRPRLAYDAAVEEALCVGWIDSTGGTLDAERGLLWFAPRSPRSAWAGSNKARVERLAAAGLMLPAGRAAVEEAKRRGTWTMLDDAEALVVPPDLAAALGAVPAARANWDATSPSGRRIWLGWIAQARRPETRARRIAGTARLAALGRLTSPGQPGQLVGDEDPSRAT